MWNIHKGELTMKKYKVLKKFVVGGLSGLTVTEITSEKYEVGEVYNGNGKSRYLVLSCREITNKEFI